MVVAGQLLRIVNSTFPCMLDNICPLDLVVLGNTIQQLYLSEPTNGKEMIYDAAIVDESISSSCVDGHCVAEMRV